MSERGQSLLELALALPVLLALALGAVDLTRLATARSGLDAAAAAAAAAAARAPDAAHAADAGKTAFRGVAAAYHLEQPAVEIGSGPFQRAGTVSVNARGRVSLGLIGVSALRPVWELRSTATARIEDWRSRP